MTLVEVTRQKQRIDDLFKLSNDLPGEVQAHWSRYLCILIAGFLEISVVSGLLGICAWQGASKYR
jgi:hypothetical protein